MVLKEWFNAKTVFGKLLTTIRIVSKQKKHGSGRTLDLGSMVYYFISV